MDQNTKRCARCAATKAWGEFYIDRKRGRPGAYCKPCAAAHRRETYVPRPIGHAANCKQCGISIAPPGRASRPRLFCGRGCLTAWHNANQTRDYRRDSWLRTKYGVSLGEYLELLARQNGTCRLCDSTEAEAKHGVLDVDHDHTTGAVRGLLCHRCNWIIGLARDDSAWLHRAADYLEASASD